MQNRWSKASPALRLSLPIALILLLAPLTGSFAATPGSGSVSGSSPTATWTGPVKVPTGSANCGGPDSAGCDNYKLTIQPLGTPFQVAIKLAPQGDWDLQVYSPDGALIGSSGNGPNQLEIVTLTNPPAGTYTVSGSPFAPLAGADGNSYTASATLVALGSGTQPPPGNESISYANHPAPSNLGGDAGEPSVGSNWKSGNAMFQAGLTTLRASFDDSTSPASVTWKDVSFPTTSAASLDPIGFMDPVNGRWFSSQLSGTTSLAAFTDDDGASWLPSEGGPLNGGVDHQTIGIGPFAPPLTRAPNGPVYPNAVYYCSQDLVAALCARSDTGGATFNPAVPIYTGECGGLHGHVKVAPDGTVYVPNKSCGGKQSVAVSEDNGVTWAVRDGVPTSTNGEWDPSVGIASDGTVYLGYGDGDGVPKVAVSKDKGRTWTNVRDVGSSLGIKHTAFAATIAGDPNRAAFAFLGSTEPTPGAMGDDPNWPGHWDLYVATTYDGGNTWTTVNATPNDPVQRGTICGGGFGGCDNGTRNLLDFMDAVVDKDGRVLVGYADGCVGACSAGGPNSFTALATIARQVNGKRLFAAADVTGVPSAPVATAKASAGPPPANVISWSAPDNHGSAITGYTVYRRTGSGASTVLATVGGSTTSYSDSQIQPGQTYAYKVAATNANGTGPASPEVTPEAVKPAEDPCQEPGVTVLTDGSGDALDDDPAHDVQSLSLAEPRSIGLGNVEFVLKMASLANLPADTIWPVLFAGPDGADRFVRMRTNAVGAVSFGYGTGSSVTGAATPADSSSRYSADGTIRIVVPRSGTGAGAGATLKDFLVRIRIDGVAVSITPDNMPDSLARTGTYKVTGNENCSTPQADLTISSGDITFSGLKGKGNDQVIVAIVHNAGTAPASAVKVRFAVDGAQIGTATIGAIPAGGTGRASVVWDTKGQNGTRTITVTADPDNAIAESSESNNSGSRTVTVKGGKVS